MNRLKYLLQETRISQRELQRLIDMPHSVISNLSDGTRPFREIHIDKLTAFFNVTTDYLLGRSDSGIIVNSQYGNEEIVLTQSEYEQLKDKILTNIVELPVAFSISVKTSVEERKETILNKSVYRELLGRITDYNVNGFMNRRIIEYVKEMSSDELEKTLFFIEHYIK